MINVTPLLRNATASTPSAAIFLSGSGSNAERIIEFQRQAGETAAFTIGALVTDRPQTSRARQLASQFNLPLVENDIGAFYRERGESRVSIATPAGRQLRTEWTDQLRRQLEPYHPDFGILAGFVPLTNLTADFPCLNVHPGDLTYLENGRRHLVGLHSLPVERAILADLDELRSSVILATPYSGAGDDMDSGPILGLSGPVAIDLQGQTPAALAKLAASRPSQRPTGGYRDLLEQIANHNLERLKVDGDWVVFPRVVADFARGRFAVDQHGELAYRLNDRWLPIATVVYGKTEREIILREAGA